MKATHMRSIIIITMMTHSLIFAHGNHKRYSRAFLDPFVTHHAILEDELRLNFLPEHLTNNAGTNYTTTIELAYAFTDAIGSEIFIPVSDIRSSTGSVIGIGDIVFQPLKYSFIRNYELVMTTYFETVLPTGKASSGTGEGKLQIVPHFLTDAAFGDFSWQTNAASSFTFAGDVGLEYRTSLAYSFFLSVEDDWSISPLVELTGETSLAGGRAGKSILTVIPGLKMAYRGWHFGVAYQAPVTTARDFDYRLLVTAGFHISWSSILGGRKQERE